MGWRRTTCWLLVWATLVVLGACASSPPVRQVQPAGGLSLPIAMRVALQVDPAMPPTQTVEYRGAGWSYADAELMQAAALNVFGQVFQEAAVAPTADAPVITLQLNGSSSLNPVLGEYHANATVTVFAGADTASEAIAFFAGTGQGSQPNPDDGVWQAYDAAFREIAELLLVDPHLLSALSGHQEQ
ncbi:MAG: hypothetical protein U1E63_16400 [Burkholderiales bacterium]